MHPPSKVIRWINKLLTPLDDHDLPVGYLSTCERRITFAIDISNVQRGLCDVLVTVLNIPLDDVGIEACSTLSENSMWIGKGRMSCLSFLEPTLTRAVKLSHNQDLVRLEITNLKGCVACNDDAGWRF